MGTYDLYYEIKNAGFGLQNQLVIYDDFVKT